MNFAEIDFFAIIKIIVETIIVAGTIAFVMSSFEIIKILIETLLAISTISIAMIANFQGKKNNERNYAFIGDQLAA
jgi:hypothetical protein